MAKRRHRRPLRRDVEIETVEQPPAPPREPGVRTLWIVGVVVAVALAAAVPLAAALHNPSTAGEVAPAPVPTFAPPPPPAPKLVKADPAHPATGKQLFADNCGTCHTLQAAGSKSLTGPNLDKLKPGRKRVLDAIRNGGSGYGFMQPNLVRGSDAKRVARFVAAASRR